jgi:EmrB/QacA subfamily drug resistance transporter
MTTPPTVMTPEPKTSRPLVIAAVMASMFMIAIEATIVSTAMPQIVAQLGGLRLYSWVFASFLLTQTATTVVFGKLADTYGRKPIMLVGIAVFLIGSILAGLSSSMPMLIAFRLIQGVGAGAVLPVALTIVGDLYPARERGKIQGYLASVWAISAVLGPIAGGLIIRNLSWAWIFWINVPVGGVAAIAFLAFLQEARASKGQSIDIVGAVLLIIAVASLMVVLTDIAEISALIAALVFCVSSILFVLQERRTPDPMISFAMWARRPIAATNGVGALANMALMGVSTFLPVYVQGVLHRSPLVAGLTLTTMLVGWPAAATIASRTFHIIGLRRTLIAGSTLIPAGAFFFIILGSDSSVILPALGSLVMGFGMGFVSMSSIVLIQEIVPWSQRASATASNLFARNIGSTLGATLFGAVLNYRLSRAGIGAISSDQLRALLESPEASGGATTTQLALDHALHVTFWVMLLISSTIVFVALLVPPIAINRETQR